MDLIAQNSLWISNSCRDICDFSINEISFCACIWVQDMEFYNVMGVLSDISSWTTCIRFWIVCWTIYPKKRFPEWPWTRPNQVISFSLIAHCLFFFLSHPSRPVIIWCLTSGISRMSFHCLYYEFYCICSVDVHVKLVCHAHWLIWAHARSLDRLSSCQCKGICCDRVEQTLPGYFDTDRELMGVSLYQCVITRGQILKTGDMTNCN